MIFSYADRRVSCLNFDGQYGGPVRHFCIHRHMARYNRVHMRFRSPLSGPATRPTYSSSLSRLDVLLHAV